MGIAAVVIILSLAQTIFAGSEQRFAAINLFTNPEIREEIVQKVNFERNVDPIGKKLSVFFHNRPVEYFISLRNAYLNNLSFDFLFISGDKNPVHNITGTGELCLVEIIFILIGLVVLWNKNKKLCSFLIFWILIVPLATALLVDSHALRM